MSELFIHEPVRVHRHSLPTLQYMTNIQWRDLIALMALSFTE
jgi:hypothetical protein